MLIFSKEWKDKPKPNKNGLPIGERKEQWEGTAMEAKSLTVPYFIVLNLKGCKCFT